MRKAIIGILLVALAVVLQPVPAVAGDLPPEAVPVIVDTDMGRDDWVGLLYLASSPRARIIAVTVSGNGIGMCPGAAANAVRLLRLAGKAGIPVGCGSPYPLQGYQHYPQQWRDELRTLPGLGAASAGSRRTYPDSARLLADTLRSSARPVRIVSMGAMTTIAAALAAEPQLRPQIAGITAMFGAVDVPGNIRVPGFTGDHPNRLAEWNAYIDPVAGKRVLDSGVPVRLVPLDATNQVPLRPELVRRLGQGGPQAPGRYVRSLLRPLIPVIGGVDGAGEYYHWDPLAAVVLTHPDLCDLSTRRLTVVARTSTNTPYFSGYRSFPLLDWQGRARQALDERTAGDLTPVGAVRPVQVCTGVGVAQFERVFAGVLAPIA